MEFKAIVKRWLGIDGDLSETFNKKLQENINYLDKKLREHKKEILRELTRHTSVEVDYLITEQRLDALCDLLDIDITADHMTGKSDAIVTSVVKDQESLTKNKCNIEKILMAEKIIQIQMKTYRRINQLTREMK